MTDTNTNEINAQAEFFSDFIQAQSELLPFKKDTQGYGYKYMTLDQLLGIARPIFNRHGIAITHDTESEMTDTGVILTVRTVLFHRTGFVFKSSPRQFPVEVKPKMSLLQCIGSSETYARRYSLQTLLGVCAEDDDDNRSAVSAEESRYVTRQQAPKPVDLAKVKDEGRAVAGSGRDALRTWMKSLSKTTCAELISDKAYIAELDQIVKALEILDGEQK